MNKGTYNKCLIYKYIYLIIKKVCVLVKVNLYTNVLDFSLNNSEVIGLVSTLSAGLV